MGYSCSSCRPGDVTQGMKRYTLLLVVNLWLNYLLIRAFSFVVKYPGLGKVTVSVNFASSSPFLYSVLANA